MAELGFKPRWTYPEFYDFPFSTWGCNTSRRQEGESSVQQAFTVADTIHPVWNPCIWTKKHRSSPITQAQVVEEVGWFGNVNQPLTIPGKRHEAICVPHTVGTQGPGCWRWRHPLAFSTQVSCDLNGCSCRTCDRDNPGARNQMLLPGYQYFLAPQKGRSCPQTILFLPLWKTFSEFFFLPFFWDPHDGLDDAYSQGTYDCYLLSQMAKGEKRGVVD